MPAKRRRRERGEGSISYHEHSGRWLGQLSLGRDRNGKRIRITVYGKSREEVATRLHEARDNKTGIRAKSETLGEFLAGWLRVVEPSIQAETYRQYKRYVNKHIEPEIGSIKISNLSARDIEAFYARMAAAKASRSLIRKVGTVLSIAMNHAVTLRVIPFNPARGVKKPKPQQEEIQPLSPEELAAFLEAARADRFYAMYVLLLDTGARPGEVFALRWNDFDEEKSAVTITKSLEECGKMRIKETKTPKSRRMIHVSDICRAALAEHRRWMLAEGRDTSSGAIFVTPRGSLIRRTKLKNESFAPILARAGIKRRVRLYDLRHTSATILLAAGESTKVISERLGHSTTVITSNTYQHVLPQMQKQAATTMQSLLEAIKKTATPPER